MSLRIAKTGYLKVQETIRQRILSGEWEVGAQLPSERELEQELGISRLTVSKGLSHLVAEGLLARRRGQGTFVADLNHQLRTRAVGVRFVSPMPFVNGYAIPRPGIMEGLYDSLSANGFQTGVEFYRTPVEQVALLDRCQGMQRGGAVIWLEPGADNVAAVRRLQQAKVPFVLVDAYVAGEEADFAVTDNVAGGRLMVDHLASQGHRCLAYVSRPADRTSMLDRLTGFIQGLAVHRLPFTSESLVMLEQPGDAAMRALPAAIDSLLATQPRPTAIAFSNDDLAHAAAERCRERGLRIPQDLSIMGYDNVGRSTYGDLALTTVQQDYLGMGRVAGDVLCELLTGKAGRRPVQVFLKPQLVIRDSVARIAASC